MKDRLLVLSKYSRLGASSRLRTLQYCHWLEDADLITYYRKRFLRAVPNGGRRDVFP